MPERTGYPHGVPSWVDLGSPDTDASTTFYGGLFGWATMASENPEETGGYSMFTKDGKVVAGLMPLMNPEQPAVWSTYVAVDDADEVVAKASAAGGQTIVEPMDVMDAGRMAFFIDPAGAAIGVWQAGRHTGAQLVNEHGTLTWNELATRDPDAAGAFYAAAFGWEPTTIDMGGLDYTIFNVDGKAIGGMMPMDDRWPAEVPAHWMVYFAVDDADATCAVAGELGGTVTVPAFDAEGVGRIAVINDPHGTVFSVITPATPVE